MDKLIPAINKLQKCIEMFNIADIHIPRVIVIGSQSSGKSSVLERIIHCDILPKDSQLATRCPIILELIHKENDEDITAFFEDNTVKTGSLAIQQKLQEISNVIKTENKGISNTPVRIRLHGKNFPSVTLVDLPGIIRNKGDLPAGSVEKIMALTEEHASFPYSIILAISAANVDLANSDSIQVAKKYDPTSSRTFHIITKVDLMDKGTTATQLLENNLLKPSLGVIFLVNRSQQNINEKVDMNLTKEKEKKYLKEHYPNIATYHGIDQLNTRVVEKLRADINNNLPKINQRIRDRRKRLDQELDEIDRTKDAKTLVSKINKFIDEYCKRIRGDKTDYFDQLVDGAIISDILYNQFKRDVEMLKLKELTDDQISNLMKNTTGNKKKAYSIEKPFFRLAAIENKKFLKPSLDALENVNDLLNQIVRKSIDEINFSCYSNLKEWIIDKMSELIDKQKYVTKKICENILLCENNNTFSLQPSSIETKEKTKQKQSESISSLSKESSNQNLLIIRKLIEDYFRTVQDQVIENVPKWIQTFMVDDLIEEMKDCLIFDDEEKARLIQRHSDFDNKEKDLREQSKKLKEIEIELIKYLGGI